MASETWRVVLADGDIESVSAWRTDDGTMVRWDREIVHTHTTNVRRGVCMAIEGHDLAIVEILAPGELTRAELRAQAWREGAEAMRAASMAACGRIAEQASTVAKCSAGPAAATRFTGMHHGAELCANTIDALPVPPCPEVSR